MPLTYDLREIPDDVRLVTKEDGTQEMSPVTNTLILTTMAMGIGAITEDTVDEFADRLRLYQNLHGAFMHGYDTEKEDWVDMPLTREHVQAHLGLKVNVNYETRSKWVARMITKSRDVFTKPEPTKGR